MNISYLTTKYLFITLAVLRVQNVGSGHVLGCKAQIHSLLSSAWQKNLCQQITNYIEKETVKNLLLLQYKFEIGTFALLCKELKTPSKQASVVSVK